MLLAYLRLKTMPKRIKLRANKVSIETPTEGAEPWVFLEIQRIETDEDTGIVNTVSRWDTFNMRMSDVATDSHPLLFDPSSGTMTVQDLAIELTYVFATWIRDKYNGTLDMQTLDVTIEE